MSAAVWALGHGRALALDRPRIMGIVNVTPDSFSDGGLHSTADHASAHGLALVAAGADVLDIGGESTRPGAARVPSSEQIARVIPVIERLRAMGCAAAISVDTTSAEVAARALDAGADAVNDVSAGGDDAGMLALAAERGCGLVLMHRLCAPGDDEYSHRYEREPDYSAQGGVVRAVTEFLRRRMREACAAGVRAESVLLDPGLGFGKTVAQNFELMAGIGAMQRELGAPLLGAASRKSFLGAVSGMIDPAGRDAESIGAAVAMLLAGGRVFRVHDVEGHRRALAVAWRMGGPGAGIAGGE